MCKNNKFQHKNKSVEDLIKLIPKYYAILIANRGTNYRKELYSYMDRIFPPGKPLKTWKHYFLYPSKIPSFGKVKILLAMWEALNLQIQTMEDDLIDMKDSHIKKIKEIDTTLDCVKKFKSIYHGKK